jgi:hypothetical protein
MVQLFFSLNCVDFRLTAVIRTDSGRKPRLGASAVGRSNLNRNLTAMQTEFLKEAVNDGTEDIDCIR